MLEFIFSFGLVFLLQNEILKEVCLLSFFVSFVFYISFIFLYFSFFYCLLFIFPFFLLCIHHIKLVVIFDVGVHIFFWVSFFASKRNIERGLSSFILCFVRILHFFHFSIFLIFLLFIVHFPLFFVMHSSHKISCHF